MLFRSGAMMAAGVVTALAAHPAASGTGAFGPVAQACALIALAAALTPAIPFMPSWTGWLRRNRVGTS